MDCSTAVLPKVKHEESELFLDDEHGHHTEHTVVTFGMGKDVAVVRPEPRLGAFHNHIKALARGDIQRIAPVRHG